MRPHLSFLSDDAANTIVDQARITLQESGVEIHHDAAIDALGSSGAKVDRATRRVRLVIADHTRRHPREAVAFLSLVLDRDARPRWEQTARRTLAERAKQEIARHLREYRAPDIPAAVTAELGRRMTAAARSNGLNRLPSGP